MRKRRDLAFLNSRGDDYRSACLQNGTGAPLNFGVALQLYIAFSVAATENIGKYGRMRKKYLQEHRPGLFNRLVLSEKFYAHCAEIDATARWRIDIMLTQLAKAAGASEELKARDPMKWVGLMNTYKAQTEETVLAELIYN